MPNKPRQPKKMCQEDEVAGKRFTGVVESYNQLCGYGFVKRIDNGEKIFAHRNRISVRTQLRPSLGVGETIEFEIVRGKKHREAVSITGPAGAPVLGNRLEVFLAMDTYNNQGSIVVPARRPEFPHDNNEQNQDSPHGNDEDKPRCRDEHKWDLLQEIFEKFQLAKNGPASEEHHRCEPNERRRN